VIRDATELGATDVFLAPTVRSIVRLDEGKATTKEDRWRRIAEQAARQSGRADPPRVALTPEWRSALERAANLADARFVLDPHAGEPLGPRLGAAIARDSSLAIAVGPEGGLAPEEIEQAELAGFTPASVGRFVLRTETVAAAVLGAVRVLQG
jgi:16S rRNA (uracil1498-N3)-methyltransferase